MAFDSATERDPDQVLKDAQCVRLTLQRSVQTLPSVTRYDIALGKVLTLVKNMWLKERQLVEELAKLEVQLERRLVERKRAIRAVNRRERRVIRETRELEAKKRSLETYRHILAAPVNRPQTVGFLCMYAFEKSL